MKDGSTGLPSVAVLGGGIGGLSAAHELAERGFSVQVYEKDGERFGGKARSVWVSGSGVDGRQDLPGEHGFRFFPGFYRHLPDTMQRIPLANGNRTVADNLVPTSRLELARKGERPLEIPLSLPRNLADLRQAMRTLADCRRLGIGDRELAFFFGRLLVNLSASPGAGTGLVAIRRPPRSRTPRRRHPGRRPRHRPRGERPQPAGCGTAPAGPPQTPRDRDR